MVTSATRYSPSSLKTLFCLWLDISSFMAQGKVGNTLWILSSCGAFFTCTWRLTVGNLLPRSLVDEVEEITRRLVTRLVSWLLPKVTVGHKFGCNRGQKNCDHLCSFLDFSYCREMAVMRDYALNELISPPRLVCKKTSSDLHALFLGFLFNCTDLAKKWCKTSSLYNSFPTEIWKSATRPHQ